MVRQFVMLFLMTATLISWGYSKTEDNKSSIEGVVVSRDGREASGIQVMCWRLSGAFPCEKGCITTDATGKYRFEVIAGHTYEIHAGGCKSTAVVSRSFDVRPGETHAVEPLEVRLALNVCEGIVRREDGKPAGNLPYGYLSESLTPSCIDPASPPKTDANGRFKIPGLLPDELFSFWIFPKENTLCVWRRLDPGVRDHELIVRSKEFIDLPSDWLYGCTHYAIARQKTYAENSRIAFNCPDGKGNLLSLGDRRFEKKAVLVNIYGSWCGGCQAEIPWLVHFKNKYGGEGLEIVGIAFEQGSKEQQLQAIQKTAQTFNVNYPLLVGGASEAANVENVIQGLKDFKGYPTTLYIDRHGKVRHIQTGFWIHTEPHKKWQLEHMEKNIRQILAEDGEE